MGHEWVGDQEEVTVVAAHGEVRAGCVREHMKRNISSRRWRQSEEEGHLEMEMVGAEQQREIDRLAYFRALIQVAVPPHCTLALLSPSSRTNHIVVGVTHAPGQATGIACRSGIAISHLSVLFPSQDMNILFSVFTFLSQICHPLHLSLPFIKQSRGLLRSFSHAIAMQAAILFTP